MMMENLSNTIKLVNPSKDFNKGNSAGGIIYDSTKHLILVVRGKQKWSLPKGHKEIGEKPYQTAKREIYEETSLNLDLNELSKSIQILKCTYFLISMGVDNKTILLPKDTDEIQEISWFNKYQLQSKNCNKQLRYILRNWNTILKCFP